MKKILLGLIIGLLIGCSTVIFATEQVNTKLKKNEVNKNISSDNELPISKTIKNTTIKLDKVTQDTDSLRLHVEYINSNDKHNDKHNEKDTGNAPDIIQIGITKNTIIFLKPIDETNYINSEP